MTKLTLIFTSALLLILSCGRKDGYKESGGLLYKRIYQSADTQKVKFGDYLVMRLAYYAPNDSLLFDSREIAGDYRMRLAKPSYPGGGSIEDALMSMHRGDSASFKIDAESFFGKTRNVELPDYLQKGDLLRFEIRLIDIQDESALQHERELFNQRMLQQEQGLLADYVAKNMPDIKPTTEGVYIKTIKSTSGRVPLQGQTLTIHFESLFINGELFESTYRRKKPFSFVLGAEQAIPGLEVALAQMHQGEKVQILVPSNLAYGAQGFGKKIPPYSPLIFNVELLLISNSANMK